MENLTINHRHLFSIRNIPTCSPPQNWIGFKLNTIRTNTQIRPLEVLVHVISKKDIRAQLVRVPGLLPSQDGVVHLQKTLRAHNRDRPTPGRTR